MEPGTGKKEISFYFNITVGSPGLDHPYEPRRVLVFTRIRLPSDAFCLVPTQDPYTYDEDTYADTGYEMGDEEYDEDYEQITQEDCWTIISSFFDAKGLVRQQLDSFDEFVQNTMQELVDENSDLILDAADQHTGHAGDVSRRYELKFGQIYLSRPTITEADGSVVPVFPQEARLRNLTYSAPLYIEMAKRVLVGQVDPNSATGEMVWEQESAPTAEDSKKVWIGKVSTDKYHRKYTIPPKNAAGPHHVAINLLYSPRSPRPRPIRSERMPIRFGRVLYHQRFRKGPHRPGAYGDKPRLCFRQSTAVTNQLLGGDSECCGEGWEDHQSIPSEALPPWTGAFGKHPA